MTLPTIPRAATISGADNFNDEQNPKITYGNPAGNAVSSLQACISLTGSTDNIAYRNISKTGSSYTFNLTTAERNVLRSATTTGNSRTVYFYVRTVLSGNTSHSSLGRTLSIVNANPGFSSSQLTYQDTNSTITAITNNNQLIVRNKSTLSYTFTAASPQKSAAISKYQTIFNGVTTDRTSAGTYSYGVINSAQNLTFQVKAIDSRGNNTTISKTVTILDWVPPIINATAIRVNNYENQTNLLANVQISSVNGLNSIQQLRYRKKKTADSTWGSWINFQNSTQTQINLDNLFAWDLQISATDKFGTSTHNLAVPKGMPIMFFDTNKLSVGVNCFPAKSSSLEVNGKTIFDMVYPIGSIYMSISSINPSTLFGGTWVAWGQGRVPVGVASSGTFNTVEKTGGAETHTLTTGQMPTHGGHIPNGAYAWGWDTRQTYLLWSSQGFAYSNNRPYVQDAGNELAMRSYTEGSNQALPKYLISNSHDPIIDRETFEKAQSELKRRSKKSLKARKDHIFTGKIICGTCGSPYKHKTNNAGTKYAKSVWICNTFNSKGKSFCSSSQVPEDILKNITAEVLQIPKFDKKIFNNNVQMIEVPEKGRLNFILCDGTQVKKSWRY